jgi:DeoR family transcriptional regulator, fructose operon transcriptional repressor
VYAAERQQRIVEQARADGRVEVASVAAALGVTPETVRRDLTILERHGVLRRVHGGAIPLENLGFEPRLAVRQERYTAEKERIAKRALEELPAEGTVLIDAGSTTQLLAENMPYDRELTVVTNSVPVAAAVAGRDNLTLYVVGGRVRGRTMAAVGEWATHALADVALDVAFLGTNGLSVRRGLTTPDQDEAASKRAMAAASRRVVVLCDHSKIGTDHFAQFATLADVDTVITDTELDDETAAEIEAAGPTVVRA